MDDRQLAFVSFHGTFIALTFRATKIIMVELEYVKKRKRRKIVAIASGIATFGIVALVIISFLGRNVGTFTVSLNAGNVDLSLFSKLSSSGSSGESSSDQEQAGSSFLRVETLPAFQEWSFDRFSNEKPYYELFKEIDSDTTSYLFGQEEIEDQETHEISYYLKYFKYTFFIYNPGTIDARYVLNLKVQESNASTKGLRFESTLRVMLFENDVDNINDPNGGTHDYTVYARQAEGANKYWDSNHELQLTDREYISRDTSWVNNPEMNYGTEDELAEKFVDDTLLVSVSNKSFHHGDCKRYTLVLWIDGNDPQSKGDAPEGASLKLGVEINAYEKNK